MLSRTITNPRPTRVVRAGKVYVRAPYPQPEINFKWWTGFGNRNVRIRRVRKWVLSNTNPNSLPKRVRNKVYRKILRKEKRKKISTPKTLEELREGFNRIDCTELTRFLWKRIEINEKECGKFKNIGEAYAWTRANLKTEILYEQSVTSKMRTAGKSYCSLCMAERINIFCHINDSKKSKKLMNKRSELTGKCSCNARFLRLYLKGEGGADEASSGCRKLACMKASVTRVHFSDLRSKLRGRILRN